MSSPASAIWTRRPDTKRLERPGATCPSNLCSCCKFMSYLCHLPIYLSTYLSYFCNTHISIYIHIYLCHIYVKIGMLTLYHHYAGPEHISDLTHSVWPSSTFVGQFIDGFPPFLRGRKINSQLSFGESMNEMYTESNNSS